MSKFCGNCGAVLNDNDTFCANCGTAQPSGGGNNNSNRPVGGGAQLLADPTSKRWLIFAAEQIICGILALLPITRVKISYWGESESQSFSIFEVLKNTGHSSAFVIIFLILLFAGAALTALPILIQKPVEVSGYRIAEVGTTAGLRILQIVSIAFLAIVIINFLIVNGTIKDLLGSYNDSVSFGFSIWGWIYIIASVASIGDMFYYSYKLKNA